jgi:2'-5' RNA ligase
MYYIAILAPGNINEQVLKWKHFMRDRFGCSNALKSPAHITLVPPFWQDESKETLMKQLLLSLATNHEGFLVELDKFDAFRPHVLFLQVIPSHPLLRLHEQLLRMMHEGQFAVKADTRPFHPHITIATRDLQKKDFEEANGWFQKQDYIANFRASGIALMKHNGANWDLHFNAPFGH